MSVEYGFKAEDIIKEGRVSVEEIDAIRRWNRSQEIPILTDEQIVGFVIACERNLKFTEKTIIEYYKGRRNMPEVFEDKDISRADLQLQLQTLEYIAFTKRTADGCLILHHKLFDFDYRKYMLGPSLKLFSMTLDAALYKYPPTGLIIFFDMKGVGLMHLTRIKINLLSAALHYVQEALPVKLMAIHVLNSTYLIDKILSILKPFLKSHIYEKLHFHLSSLDMDTFYQKHIPRECLPVDYGGELPDTRTLHAENTKTLEQLKPFFDAEAQQRRNINKAE